MRSSPSKWRVQLWQKLQHSEELRFAPNWQIAKSHNPSLAISYEHILICTTNPAKFWRVKKIDTTWRNFISVLSPEYDDWMSQRCPVWRRDAEVVHNVMPCLAGLTRGRATRNFWVRRIPDSFHRVSPVWHDITLCTTSASLLHAGHPSDIQLSHSGLKTLMKFRQVVSIFFPMGSKHGFSASNHQNLTGSVVQNNSCPGSIHMSLKFCWICDAI